MKCLTTALLLAAAVAASGSFTFAAETDPVAAPVAVTPANTEKPVVQIAVLLDTSTSMNGLIDQAKAKLWAIVVEMAKTQRDGQAPDIEVALYHYGSPALGQDNHYVKQLVPLTGDLDKVSKELFALKTSGGQEYCGAVIAKATDELQWTDKKGAYKAIFIAGNEPFTQGPVPYKDACKAAIAKGIMVNTIYCGDETSGINSSWKDGATIADGAFIAINQNKKVEPIVVAPQDKAIRELSVKVNETYIPFGTKGAEGAKLQKEADANAEKVGAGIAVERAAAKASSAYQNSTWDLVDAVKDGKVKLEEVKAEELPAELQKLDLADRKRVVDEKIQRRAQINSEIKELQARRDEHIARTAPAASAADGTSLDQAILDTVRTQARTVGLEVKEPPTTAPTTAPATAPAK